MATFSLGKHPHVELCDLLKLEGWSESGAQAKIAIADGLVKVDGAVETRKRCKIVAGQTVSFEGQSGYGLSRLMPGGAALTGPTYCLHL
jgi:ribosome-associated protein